MLNSSKMEIHFEIEKKFSRKNAKEKNTKNPNSRNSVPGTHTNTEKKGGVSLAPPVGRG